MLNKIRWLVLCGMFLSVVVTFSLIYTYWWEPRQEVIQQQEIVAEEQATIAQTSSAERFTHTVRLASDSFSGYAPIRSTEFVNECGRYDIRIEYQDDQGDYRKRLKALADGKIDMATFTVDALIKCSSELGDCPATIVAVIDESIGADGMVAPGKQFPNIDAINDPETRFVCVQDSPSETLVRVVMSHFQMDKLAKEPFEFVATVDDVHKNYEKSAPDAKKVFVTWEPYLSRIKDNPDYHVLIDTSKFRGYTMDVLVARRGFLVKNEEVVENVVKSYLSAMFSTRNSLAELVLQDSVKLHNPLRQEQAEQLAETIWWKNTQENYAHFGLVHGGRIQHIDDVARNITNALVSTGGIASDPTNGRYNILYYDAIMKRLHESNWHPGFGDEEIRADAHLTDLTDVEWQTLRPVGTLQVPRLVFARGTARLNAASEATLQGLVERLQDFPSYYVLVRGDASLEGDLEANLKLAAERANAAKAWLESHGIASSRIRTEAARANGSTTVTFQLGELPY